MTMPFSKMVDTLSESMRECKDASDLNKKVLAAEELSVHAGALGTHTARFTRIAWILTMLFLFLTILVFAGVLYFEEIKNFLPPEMCRLIEPIYYSSSIFTDDADILLSDEIKSWLYCVLGLAVIPAVFDVILAAVCKHTPVTVGKTAAIPKPDVPDGDRDWARRNLSYIRETLNSAQKELDLGRTIHVEASRVLCILFMAPTAVPVFMAFMATRTGSKDLLLVIVASIIFFVLTCIPFLLILNLQQRVLTFFFSNRESRKQAEELRVWFSRNEAEYKRQYEAEWQRAREQQGAELYRRATAGGTVDRDLMDQAAEKGNPEANLLIGKRILRRVEDRYYDLTYEETLKLYEQAKSYLKNADTHDTPVGIILYAYTRVKTEWHREDEWTQILCHVRSVNKAGLPEKYRCLYDEVVEELVDKVEDAKCAVTPSMEAVMRRMYSSSSGFDSGGDRMHDDLDAVQRAREITRRYGEDWKGYDSEAPGPDPESFPDSNDIW